MQSRSLIIRGATIIDGVAEMPIEGRRIWIEDGRIRAILGIHDPSLPLDCEVIDASGMYAIPGLMNANVHLLGDVRLQVLARYMGSYEDLIVEAAQIALKNGLTTVFDTWGPRRFLTAVRDRIDAGDLPGARIYCAGNIIGLDGPFSRDFLPSAAEVASSTLTEEINAIWAENVGPALSWMTPDGVASEVRSYIDKGIDFVKYASNEHRWGDPTTSLVFSPRIQVRIVEEAHRAGLTAQAHTTSVESLHVAVEAGCDLIQHCNTTGPFPIPDSTIELFLKKGTGAVVFPFTQRRFDWIMESCEVDRAYFATSDANCRNLLNAGAMLLLANDGTLWGPDLAADPRLKKLWIAPGEDDLSVLDQGHFVWLKAMEEKGMAPMEMLRAASRNIAVAYGKDKELGTIEPGKIADILLLSKNPLHAAENYRSIHTIIKNGLVVDREALPTKRLLSNPMRVPPDEVSAYRAHKHVGRSGLPLCPMCMQH